MIFENSIQALFLVPMAISLGPMGFTMLAFQLGCFALMTALPLSIITIVMTRARIASYSTVLALTPLPLALVVAAIVCGTRGIVWVQ